MNRMFRQFSLVLFIIAITPAIHAACELNDGGKKVAFEGKNLDGIQVEKRSLPALNREFPNLNAIEKAFKGEVQTCTSCSGRFVSCGN